MPYRCIKPLCDAMNCCMCNCAIPEPAKARDVLLRLNRLHRILAAGRSVDGWIGESALADAIAEIERLRKTAPIYSAEQAQIEAPLRAQWRRECDDADSLLRFLALDPAAMRTDGGSLNLPKIKKALAGRVSF